MKVVAVPDARGEWLRPFLRNDFSQFGEDGLIEALFARIGENNRWCFEIGAHDGTFFSNTLRLRNLGWRAVLIEADDGAFATLQRQYGASAYCVHCRAANGDLDRILSQASAPANLDFGVIDIDGEDHALWDAMVEHTPRVMLVEHSYGRPDDLPAPGVQAGLGYIVELAKRKGYVPLIATQTNLLCCLESENV